MKVVLRLVGVTPEIRVPDWPWEVVPRLDDPVEIPGQGLMFVRSVTWYPEGDQEDSEDFQHPFVYVVLGKNRA